MQLVGNRELASNEILEQPCLPASEFVSFQNYAGLRGRTRTGRPYPTFHGIRKPSTCGFDFTDYAMPEGSRPGPVNRHGFGISGSAGARLAPIMGPAPAGLPLGGWRPAPRKRNTAVGGTRDVPRAPERGGGGMAAAPGARPAGGKGHRGASRPVPAPASAAGLRPSSPPAKYFPKLSLHRRGSSRIVLHRAGA